MPPLRCFHAMPFICCYAPLSSRCLIICCHERRDDARHAAYAYAMMLLRVQSSFRFTPLHLLMMLLRHADDAAARLPLLIKIR